MEGTHRTARGSRRRKRRCRGWSKDTYRELRMKSYKLGIE
jgi:hypothetical protein